ncbi:hypothetical protein ACFO4E_07325 [Nocardiopsis mangrovi]|uniref:DoxX family protein n=1 Tax=Nocardiopsis mangrovi TaxID=1179818 RepID=A0ABV9DTG1_9ACTN
MDPSSGDAARLFDALHHSGFLYEFIGICQMGAAFLLLVPPTALLGACVYLPIIAGIEVITTTMDFRGTWVITSLMLLGCVPLLCRDYHRIKYIVVPAAPPASLDPARTGG